MPNPKRRHSKQRTATRRANYKATAATISVDSSTGEALLMHSALWFEGYLYYK